MTRNAPRHIALAVAITATVLASATPLHAQEIHPGNTDAEARHARIENSLLKQRLAGAALVGIAVPGGIMLARSRNEWNPDEGWIGLGIAAWSAATGLFLLIEPLSWRTAGAEARVHAAEGAAARHLRLGRGGGAALSIAW